MKKYFNKNARGDAEHDAENDLGNCNQYNPGSESWKQYEAAYAATFTPSEKAEIRRCLSTGDDLGFAEDPSEELYQKLVSRRS